MRRKDGPKKKLSDCCADVVFCLTGGEHALDKCGAKSLNPCQPACGAVSRELDNRRTVNLSQTQTVKYLACVALMKVTEKMFIEMRLNQRRGNTS